MILVSSARPIKDCSPEILRNQLRALDSWMDQFSAIVYFNKEEAFLVDDRVTFVEMKDGNFPHIKHLMEFCAQLQGWSAIVNADIVISGGIREIEKELVNRGALCAMSRRFEFEGENINDGRMIDNGLDFFCAAPSVWKLAAKLVPKDYRIGHCLWDTWLLGFMASHYYNWLWDFTECRVVFHPKHEDRRRIFPIDPHAGKEQLDRVVWPAISRRLKIKSIADVTTTKPEHFQ